MGRDIVVRIVTRYGLDSPGIQSQWRRDFRNLPYRRWGPTRLQYIWYRVFSGIKAEETWRWPIATSRAEVKEILELCIFSPSGLSRPVLGCTLPLFYPWCSNGMNYIKNACYSATGHVLQFSNSFKIPLLLINQIPFSYNVLLVFI